ncbi:hypothetical protein E4T48_02187 [Aureobasidium sp. EXF-10727]|nr:hypothetical protein E4T48_02187 [Aureobasidium sp. EXF-10727]
MAAKYAVSLMALLGAVSAQSSSYNSYTNSSSIASATSSSASPQYTDGSTVTVGSATYLIQTDTSYQGTVLNLARKRQADSSIQSCLSVCSADVACKGTAYVSDTGNCIYYSSVDLASKATTTGTDFALVQKRTTDSTTSSVFNGTMSATSGGAGATRTPGQSGNSTASSTRSASRSAGVTGGAGNSTSLRPTGSASATSSGAVSTPVPSSPSTIITINGVVFLLEIDISYTGVKINFAIILAKRAGNSLDDCLVTCADNASCAGTAFDEASGTCTFYSSIDDASRAVDTGNDFATVISRAGANNGGASNNGTSVNGTTPAAPSNVTAESFICPRLNGNILVSNVEVTFAISCSEFLIGTTYDALAEIRQKRQAIDNTLPSTLSNCVDLCSLAPSCVGTTFEIATEQCSYYSDVSYATPLDGFDSAVRVQDNSGNGNGGAASTITTSVNGQGVTVTVPGQTTTAYVAGPTSTATVYAIVTSTVYANGGVTGLPSGAVVTTAVPTSTVTYVNPVSTITMPQNYGQSTVTVTVGNGGAAATQTVYQTVDQNGNVIGSSTAGAVAGGAGNPGAAYPTVTVYSSYCPQATQGSVVWTTVYVR